MDSNYWSKRFEKLEETSLEKGSKLYNELEKQYSLAYQEIEKDILKWYNRFAKDNGISFAEAKIMLTKGELKEFKWTLEDYIKYASNKETNKLWAKELQNASTRVHISRLDSLRIQIQNEIEAIYDKQLQGMIEVAETIYDDRYYHTAYELQTGCNVAWKLNKLDNKAIQKVLSIPWTDGSNFSSKIWQNKDTMMEKLKTGLAQNFIRGSSPDELIKSIAKEFKTDLSKAGRLVMTESAFFAAEAQKDCFNDLGVEQYQILGTLDTTTCHDCGLYDLKIFDMKDYQEGITAPPFHPWCRCTTIPYFKDMMQFGERAARDTNGKTFYVPRDMKYEEWKEKYVTNNDNSLKNTTNNDKMNININKKENEMNYQDITSDWKEKATPNSHKIKLNNKEFIDNKTHIIYKVDNRHVIFKPSKNEQNVARWLENTLGGKIEMNPRISNPPSTKIPDYYFRGMRFDLKEINGNGKNTIDTAIKSKKEQADNFILDIQEDCKIQDDEIMKQIEKIYNAKNRRWVNVIIVKRREELIKIYKRK